MCKITLTDRMRYSWADCIEIGNVWIIFLITFKSLRLMICTITFILTRVDDVLNYIE